MTGNIFYPVIQSLLPSILLQQGRLKRRLRQGKTTDIESIALTHVRFLENLQKDKDEVRRQQESVEAIQEAPVAG